MLKKLLILSGCLFCLIIAGVIYYFYPKQPYAINDLTGQQPIYQQNVVNPATSQPQNISFTPTSTITSDKQIYDTLIDFIRKAPFDPNSISAIMGANDTKTQNYLKKFSNFIQQQVIDNPSLSNEQKAQILWEIYKQENWQNTDNGFKGVINDALMWIDISYILPEITNTYDILTTKGDQTVNTRHDLLMYATSGKNQINLVNPLLLKQLQSKQNTHETKELSHFAIQGFINHNDVATINQTLPQIMYHANTNTVMADVYMNAMLLNILKDSEKADNIFPQFLTLAEQHNLQNALNHALAFQLSADRNLELQNISTQNLKLLQNYIHQQSQNSVNIADWHTMQQRINIQIQP